MYFIFTMTRCGKYCYYPTFCSFMQGGYTRGQGDNGPVHGRVGIHIPQAGDKQQRWNAKLRQTRTQPPGVAMENNEEGLVQ